MIKIELPKNTTTLNENQIEMYEKKLNNGVKLSSLEIEDVNRSVNLILQSSWIYKLEKKPSVVGVRDVEGRRIGDWIHLDEVTENIFNKTDKSGKSWEEFLDDKRFMEKQDWYKTVIENTNKNNDYTQIFSEYNMFEYIFEQDEYAQNLVEALTHMQIMTKNFANRQGQAGRNGSMTNQYNGKIVENTVAYILGVHTGIVQDSYNELISPHSARNGHDGGVDITIDGLAIDIKTAYRNILGNKSYDAAMSATQLKTKSLEGSDVLLFTEHIGNDRTINILSYETKDNIREYWNLQDKFTALNFIGSGKELPMSMHDNFVAPYALLSKQINTFDDLIVTYEELQNDDLKYIKYQDSLFNRGNEAIIDEFYNKIDSLDIEVNKLPLNEILGDNQMDLNKLLKPDVTVQAQYNKKVASCHVGNNILMEPMKDNGNNSLLRLLLRGATQEEQLGWEHNSDILIPLSEQIKNDFDLDMDIEIPGQQFIIDSLNNGEQYTQIAEKISIPEWDEFLDLLDTHISYEDPLQFMGDYLNLQEEIQTLSASIVFELIERDYWNSGFVELEQVNVFRRKMEEDFANKGLIHEYSEVVEPVFLERQLESKTEALLRGILSESKLEYDSLDYNSSPYSKNKLKRTYKGNYGEDNNEEVKIQNKVEKSALKTQKIDYER